MLRFVLVASLIGAVLAFTPSASVRSGRVSTTMKAERSKALPFLTRPAKLDGTLAGDNGFDPLGLSNIDDIGLDLYWLAEAEIKHSRIAMLAAAGALFQEAGFVVPGLPTTKNQVAVFWEVLDKNPGPIFAATLFISIVELFAWVGINEGRSTGRKPGDYGFNPLNLGKNGKTAKDYAEKEIANGRLAMWAAIGILFQGSTTGSGALENLF